MAEKISRGQGSDKLAMVNMIYEDHHIDMFISLGMDVCIGLCHFLLLIVQCFYQYVPLLVSVCASTSQC